MAARCAGGRRLVLRAKGIWTSCRSLQQPCETEAVWLRFYEAEESVISRLVPQSDRSGMWRRRRLVLPDGANKRGCSARWRSDVRRLSWAGSRVAARRDCGRVWPDPACLLRGRGADSLSTMHKPSVCLGAPSTASFSSSSSPAGGVKKLRHPFTLFYLSDLSLWGFNRAFVCLQRPLMNCINYFTGSFSICSHFVNSNWSCVSNVSTCNCSLIYQLFWG